MTFELTDRTEFAALVRAARLTNTLRSYARFGAFGRALITTDYHVALPYYTPQPHLNIHRTAH